MSSTAEPPPPGQTPSEPDPSTRSAPPAAPAPAPPGPSSTPPVPPAAPSVATSSVLRALGDMRDHLSNLEHAYGTEVQHAEARLKPIWREATEGEHRLPVAAVVALAIGLQVALPNGLNFHPSWLMPSLESALLIGLVVANPKRIERESRLLRSASLLLIAVITVANVWSAGHLIRGLINGTLGSTAGPLLASGASIYLTNIIAFGLWYWEFDRGGPVARLKGVDPYPDFMFPQMTAERLAPPDWRPEFVDYLYVSYTNATAFSPTDVLPLTRWTKTLMGVQSGVSLATVALVIARAVNILH